MKAFKLLPYLMGILLLASCSDDDQDPAPDAASCLATKLSSNDGTETEEAILTYDAQGNVTKVSSTGGEYEGDLTLEYTNGLPTSGAITYSGFPIGTFEYSYDNQKRLTKLVMDISAFGATTQQTFEYNSQNQLTKATDSSFFMLEEEEMASFNSYTTFTYGPNGNITKKSVYEGFSPEEATLSYTIDYTYDSAPNPGRKFEMLFYGYSNPNNIKSAVYKYDGEVDEDQSYSVVYKYNASGLPYEATETTQSGAITTSTVTYTCK